jgi:hypothetical protein
MSSVCIAARYPEASIFGGAFKLHRLLIILRRHRDAGMDCSDDRASAGGIDPVAERIEPLMQPDPERNAVRRRPVQRDRAWAGDAFAADFSALTMAGDQADLEAASGLAKAD